MLTKQSRTGTDLLTNRSQQVFSGVTLSFSANIELGSASSKRDFSFGRLTKQVRTGADLLNNPVSVWSSVFPFFG